MTDDNLLVCINFRFRKAQLSIRVHFFVSYITLPLNLPPKFSLSPLYDLLALYCCYQPSQLANSDKTFNHNAAMVLGDEHEVVIIINFHPLSFPVNSMAIINFCMLFWKRNVQFSSHYLLLPHLILLSPPFCRKFMNSSTLSECDADSKLKLLRQNHNFYSTLTRLYSTC